MGTRRVEMQKLFAEGRIVNLGCGEDPCDFGERAVHVDLDVYNYPNFVQADIHHLPFKDKEFDTAVLGDVLVEGGTK
jgi:ubiquinone/menaquinone biosynthesis C-methylase UbiE